jgi:hypothetical protein
LDIRTSETLPRHGLSTKSGEVQDKALAEAAALLVLAKKARTLWSDEDDDLKEGDDE